MNSQFPGEEAAILGFEISAVADLPGVRPCPLNSAASEAAAYVTGRVSPQLALSEVLEPANWSRAELLVPDHVPLGALRVVVLSDREADKRWHVLLKSELGPALASRVQIRAWTVGDARRPRFPDDHRVTEPRALVRRGTDQRVSATTYLDPADVLEVTDDELHEDLAWLDAPDDHDEDPDLYAELYGDDPGAASERLSARLNDLPESSDDERDDDSGDPWC